MQHPPSLRDTSGLLAVVGTLDARSLQDWSKQLAAALYDILLRWLFAPQWGSFIWNQQGRMHALPKERGNVLARSLYWASPKL